MPSRSTGWSPPCSIRPAPRPQSWRPFITSVGRARGAFAELKVTLPGERLMLRSRRADLAEQELYGLLLAHFALRRLMHDASRQAGCDPDTLSFPHTVRIVRRHLPFHAAFSPSPAPPHA